MSLPSALDHYAAQRRITRGTILGIDRFMSEARAVTNFSGNAVATVLVGSWTGTIDRNQVTDVLSGNNPFDEAQLIDDGHGEDGAPADDARSTATTEPTAELVTSGARVPNATAAH